MPDVMVDLQPASRFAVAAVVALIVAAAPLAGQQPSGVIEGRVMDASRTPVAGADVTALRDGVLVDHVTTDSTGLFRFAALRPGTYAIEATQIGYRSSGRHDVQVRADRPAILALVLQLAPVGLKGLEVVAASPVKIRKEDTELGSTLPASAIAMLPTATTASQLVEQTPGARPNHVWGAATAQANNYLLDDLPVNDPGVGGQLLAPSIQWIDHVDVLGLGSSAEYGDFQGGIVAVTTKSGDNRLRGQLRATMETDALNASNISASEIGSQTEARRDIEAELRGPIWKNHLFYYVSGELTRTTSHSLNHVKQFDSRYSPFSEDRRELELFGKLTVTPDAGDRIDLEGGSLGLNVGHAGGIGYETPSATLNVTTPTSFGSASWTHAFGSHVVFDARAAAFRRDEQRNPYNGIDTPGALAYGLIPPYASYFNSPLRYRLASSSVSGKASLAVQFHTGAVENHVKLGGEANRGTYLEQRLRDGGVTWRPVVTPSFDPTDPTTWTFHAGGVPILPSTWGGEVNLDAAVENESLFLQDDITLSRHLTLSPGVRWGRWVGWLRPAGGGPRFEAASDQAAEPRIGVVYDITGKGDLVLKAHWGRYHQSMFAQFFDRAAGGNVYSNEALYYYYNPDFSQIDKPWTTAMRDTPSGSSRFQEVEQVVLNQTGPVENYHQPYVDQWVASIEKSLVQHWKLSAIYVNRRNRDMVALQDLNLASDYTVFDRVRVYGYGSGTPIDYNGYPLTLPAVYVPNNAVIQLLKNMAADPEGYTGADMPPGLSLADSSRLTWNPNYVLSNVPGATRKFDQVQFVINADYPNWGAQASLVFTRLRGNLNNVSGYPEKTAYDDPNLYSPGPYVWPNELVNAYGPLEHYADTEWKLSVWGDLPAGFQGGAFWSWTSGDHYTPQFRLDMLNYSYTTLDGHNVHRQLIEPIVGQTIFVEQRGRWTYPANAQLDLHLERLFNLRSGSVSLMLDLYNVFNYSTVTLLNQDVNQGPNYYGFLGQAGDPGGYYEAVRGRVQPRTLRLGTVVRW